METESSKSLRIDRPSAPPRNPAHPDAQMGALDAPASTTRVPARVHAPDVEPHFFRRLCDASLAMQRGQSLRSVAYAVVNESRALLDCDRVTLLVRRGSALKVQAVSSQDDFDVRSQTLRQLARLAGAAPQTETLWWHEGQTGEIPTRMKQALADYQNVATAKTVGLVPLQSAAESNASRTPASALLVIERFSPAADPQLLQRRTVALAGHAAAAAHKALEHDAVLGLGLLKSLGRLFHRRTLPKFTMAAVVLTVLSAVMFIPIDFNLEARGVLQPVIRQEVFAPIDGVVTEVNIDHGDQVRAGAGVILQEQERPLVALRNLELEMAHTRAQGQKAEALKEAAAIAVSLLNDKALTPAQLDQLRSRKKQLEETLASLNSQIELLEKKLALLAIVSPIDGRISTLDVRDRLIQLPVDRGQPLFGVSDPSGQWQLDLRMPEDRMGHVGTAIAETKPGDQLSVKFVLNSEPGLELWGKVTDISDRADLSGADQNTVRIRVHVEKDKLPHLREGAGVVAKVQCGRRPLGYVLFHDAFVFVQRHLFW